MEGESGLGDPEAGGEGGAGATGAGGRVGWACLGTDGSTETHRSSDSSGYGLEWVHGTGGEWDMSGVRWKSGFGTAKDPKAMTWRNGSVRCTIWSDADGKWYAIHNLPGTEVDRLKARNRREAKRESLAVLKRAAERIIWLAAGGRP